MEDKDRVTLLSVVYRWLLGPENWYPASCQSCPRMDVNLPHKYHISLSDVLVSVCAEEEVAATACLNNLLQTRLINGEVIGVPGLDPLLVDVNHHNLNVWALQGHDSYISKGRRAAQLT